MDRDPPDNAEPEPSGGHAADRLRDFLEGRYPEGDIADESLPLPEDALIEDADCAEPSETPDAGDTPDDSTTAGRTTPPD